MGNGTTKAATQILLKEQQAVGTFQAAAKEEVATDQRCQRGNYTAKTVEKGSNAANAAHAKELKLPAESSRRILP